jgi:hypothetical protein
MQSEVAAIGLRRSREPEARRCRKPRSRVGSGYFAATATGSSHGRPVRPKWP